MLSQRIIIFGGPDGVGKTTLAKRLSWILNIPYFKPTNQQKFAMDGGDVFAQQTRWGEPKLLDFLQQTGHSAVLDRSFVCDWAYSKVLERETAWDTIEQLDEGYAKLGAQLVIVCSEDYNRLPKDEFEKVADPKVQWKLDAAYWEYARNTRMKKMIITTTPGLTEYGLDQAIQRQSGEIFHQLFK